jgi:hypothetical protein
MLKLGLYALCCFSLVAIAESFQWELSQKRNQVERAIGKKKLLIIEEATKRKEIYRITQLLTIDFVGEKTVLKLSSILGDRFSYEVINENCYINKYC